MFELGYCMIQRKTDSKTVEQQLKYSYFLNTVITADWYKVILRINIIKAILET